MIIDNKYRIESKLTSLLNSDLFKAFDLENYEFVILEKYQNISKNDFERIITIIKNINLHESESGVKLTLKLIDSVECKKQNQFYCIYQYCSIESLNETNGNIGILANNIQKLHEINVVHGRLIPENIIICDGIPLIMGFGLIEALKIYMLTQRNLSFLPPELISGEDCHKKSDYFSIGAIVYYLYTGKELLTEMIIDQIKSNNSFLLNYDNLTNNNIVYNFVVNATKPEMNTRILKYE